MMAPATLADEGYWLARHNAGDRSVAVTTALREIEEDREAKAVDRMIHDWLGELLLDDRLAELDRAWKETR